MKITMPGSCILNPVPVVMVSCAGKDPSKIETAPNIITVAWAGTINSDPPMVSVSIRKSRHSHSLICETQEFVINLVTEDLAVSCDYCGVRSGKKENKFETCKLQASQAPGLKYAPQIEQSPLSLCCKVKDVIELGSHDMFIAEVVHISVDEKLIDASGKIMLESAKLIAYSHGEYYALGKILGFFGYSVASKAALKRRMPANKASKSGSGKKGKQGKSPKKSNRK